MSRCLFFLRFNIGHRGSGPAGESWRIMGGGCAGVRARGLAVHGVSIAHMFWFVKNGGVNAVESLRALRRMRALMGRVTFRLTETEGGR